MSIPEFHDQGPHLTEKDIRALETKLGIRLPKSYKRFLLKHNGGAPEPQYVYDEVVHYFYSLHARENYCDFWKHYEVLRSRLPEGVIPIAADTFGNAFCLAIKGKNRGKVYFWDHEGAPEPSDIRAKYPEIIFNDYTEDERPVRLPTWPGHPDLTLIADSFDEFLQSFHEGTETELPPQPDPDLELVDISLDQLLPSLDEDEDEDDDDDD